MTRGDEVREGRREGDEGGGGTRRRGKGMKRRGPRGEAMTRGEREGRRHQPHAYEHLLVGWFAGAEEGPKRRGGDDNGAGEDEGTRPTKHPQPLPRAIARGVGRGATCEVREGREHHQPP